jgi:hypothetical protein
MRGPYLTVSAREVDSVMEETPVLDCPVMVMV